jgi:hypothetical protein
VGTNGVYILRGPQLNGAITSIQVLNGGSGIPNNSILNLNIDGTRLGRVGDGSTGVVINTSQAARLMLLQLVSR